MIPDPWLVANLHDVPVRFRDVAFHKLNAKAGCATRYPWALDLLKSVWAEEWDGQFRLGTQRDPRDLPRVS